MMTARPSRTAADDRLNRIPRHRPIVRHECLVLFAPMACSFPEPRSPACGSRSGPSSHRSFRFTRTHAGNKMSPCTTTRARRPTMRFCGDFIATPSFDCRSCPLEPLLPPTCPPLLPPVHPPNPGELDASMMYLRCKQLGGRRGRKLWLGYTRVRARLRASQKWY
jgi:hypothetical protein